MDQNIEFYEKKQSDIIRDSHLNDYLKLQKNIALKLYEIKKHQVNDVDSTNYDLSKNCASICYSHEYNKFDILLKIDVQSFNNYYDFKTLLNRIFYEVDMSNIHVMFGDYANHTRKHLNGEYNRNVGPHRFSVDEFFDFANKYDFQQRLKCYQYWDRVDYEENDIDKILNVKNIKSLPEQTKVRTVKQSKEYEKSCKINNKLYALPKFHKDQRGTFNYWFAHWKAFQLVAIRCHAWKFKYLFHDIEKPLLMLLWNNDYKRVQKWHREHNRHHMEYKGNRGRDYDAMAIDMECSRYTKLDAPLNAIDTWETYYIDDTGLRNSIGKLMFW